MRSLKILLHAGITIIMIFLLAVLPIMVSFNIFSAGASEDAETSASLQLPAQPSGDFTVLVNTSLHEDTIGEWRKFFRDDDDLGVIFDDIQCIAAEGDTTGIQLAERFRAQLPENQMRLRVEDPTLLASKVETGLIDTAVFSREMADALQLAAADGLTGLTVIEVSGGAVP